ncbi:hypothetical protein AB0G04_36180 [Actinoplanes sp. NPDC023801]|uniref:hypothetical protein n=1 Tax=Actinoplanes sp. NPDC023801 TaxID=3154595 RepID=UPI00340464E9
MDASSASPVELVTTIVELVTAVVTLAGIAATWRLGRRHDGIVDDATTAERGAENVHVVIMDVRTVERDGARDDDGA